MIRVRGYDEPILRMHQFDNNTSKLSHRRQWLNKARSQFKPGPPQPCCICGRYKEIAQAHHVYPLSLQFTRGVPAPVQEHLWVCPNHHKLIHARIPNVLNGYQPKRQDDEREEALLCEIDARLIELHPID